jgi:serine/threonine protein kinase/Flp pilus assembly protein TadD
MEPEGTAYNAEASLIGKQLGDYHVLSFIAEGGQAKVYRAKDVKLGREAAVKVLPVELSADQQIITRLEKEACLASSLNHPNIITIYGIHRDNSTLYVAMELVNGKTLHETISEGRMPIPAVLDTAAQIAAGLSKAHEVGIVHRDIKSRNVMINEDGIAKILDFGLGKLLPVPGQSIDEISTVSTTSSTRPGTVMGTVNYMSPQQASGRQVDFHSDQFSFGVLLYEMITGKLPFAKPTTVQTLASIIEDEPQSITRLNSSVPSGLQAVVKRCLAKKPEDRYESTSDLAKELRELSDRQHHKVSFLRRLKILLGLLLIAALFGGAIYEFSPWIQKTYQRFYPSKTVGIQLAILPFANADNDPVSKVFCSGLAEILTTGLSRLQQFQEGFRVVPASEVRDEGILTVRDARKLFGVTMAITGSVQRAADRIRLTINLVDAATMKLVGTRFLDVIGGDVVKLQDGVLQAAADLLEVKLTGREKQVLAAGGTEVSSASESYTTGRGYLQDYQASGNIDKAISSFERAIEKDPKYALAYAGLGEAFWLKYGLTKDAKWADQAQRSCIEALTLDGNLPQVTVALAIFEIGTGRYEQAIKKLQEAMALDPMNPDTYRELGKAYQAAGQLGNAESTFRKAIAVQPKLWSSHNELGKFYFRQGRYQEAEAEYRKVLDISADNTYAQNNLAAMFYQQERYEEAAAMFEKLAATKPGTAFSNLGTVYFMMGRYSDAARAMERAIQLDDRSSKLWYNLAAAYQWAPGEREKAHAAFLRAAELVEQERHINPRDPDLMIRLADCDSMLGRRQQSRDLVKQALRLAPDDVEIMFQAAVVYEQLGDRPNALEWIGKAIRGGYSRDLIQRSRSLEPLRTDARFREFGNP